LACIGGYRASVTRQSSRWLVDRGPILRSDESRQFVNEALAELAASRFIPSAWVSFIVRSLARSVDQIRLRPAAATEVTAIHLVAGAVGSWRWAFMSWCLCITHLGLLGHRSNLGWPNRLTLLRAHLPSLVPTSRWTSLIALASDFVDGRWARRGGESAFAAFADPIADGVFWSWYALRWEANPWLRWVPITLFGGSVAVIAVAYFARGRTVDYPRPVAVRYASGIMQIVLTLRAMRLVAR
jgi:CDP-alcohol phosphatidyltransferase-like enzyme